MFTKNWDAAILAAVYRSELPDTFAIDMGGAAQKITANLGGDMLMIGLDPSSSGNTTPSIGVLNTKNSSGGGVILGTGDTSPTYADYKLSGNIISTFSYMQNTKKSVTDKGIQLSATYTITNTGTEAFTIREVGLIAAASNSSSASYKLLLERTVLDSPVTIEPNGVGQVTYTININMPNA